MGNLREIAKKVPVLPFVYKRLRNSYRDHLLRSKTTAQVFTEIYRTNEWGGTESVSGPGSELDQTQIIIQEIPALLRQFKVSTMLDIPCGDFNWMQKVDLGNIDYTGSDIVEDLIQQNTRKYASHALRFKRLNLMEDELPKVDLVFCRDCLVHFSFADMFRALHNICSSGSKYLLTTTYTDRTVNYDIVTGQWCVRNLEAAPFMLPRPLRIINEGCTEHHGACHDKSLGLWRIGDVRSVLKSARPGRRV